MSDITHRKQLDILFSLLSHFAKLRKVQEKLLNIIHTVTNDVIDKKSKAIDEQLKNAGEQKGTRGNKSNDLDAVKNTNQAENNNPMKLHYVRDDLDDIDENDVGEKRRLAFLETMLTLKKVTGEMTDEEVRDEVNTIMFEVQLSYNFSITLNLM